MANLTKFLIVDVQAIFRAGMRSLLTTRPDFEVVGEANNGMDAILNALQLKPDVIISDLSLSGTNGAEAIKRIKSRNPNIKALVLTAHDSEEQIHNAFESGADGYILKDSSSYELFIAIKDILAGKTYLCPSICGNVVTGYLDSNNDEKNSKPVAKLTTREREVIKLVADGFRNKDIAKYLSISMKTVEKHRSAMMRKLNLHNASAVISYAMKNKIITEYKTSSPPMKRSNM
jgi:DNA-binding NarL/FixJ family response regulator